MRIYCASPLTAPTPEKVGAHIDHAVRVGIGVRAAGHVPVVPHITVPPFPGMDLTECWGSAMAECLNHLATCDGLLLTGDWQVSKGCIAELAFAYSNKIPVFYSIEEVAA